MSGSAIGVLALSKVRPMKLSRIRALAVAGAVTVLSACIVGDTSGTALCVTGKGLCGLPRSPWWRDGALGRVSELRCSAVRGPVGAPGRSRRGR
jgi:hypothetical protein